MLISDICGSSMNIQFKSLGRDEHGNLRFRILREPREKRMDWLYKHKDKESVHEGTKKSISPNESHFELPVFSW